MTCWEFWWKQNICSQNLNYDAELITLQWHHNKHNGVSNYQPHNWLLKRLVRHWSKKTSKLRFPGLYAGNSPVTGEFPTQMASNAKNVFIWWCHHEKWPIIIQPTAACLPRAPSEPSLVPPSWPTWDAWSSEGKKTIPKLKLIMNTTYHPLFEIV